MVHLYLSLVDGQLSGNQIWKGELRSFQAAAQVLENGRQIEGKNPASLAALLQNNIISDMDVRQHTRPVCADHLSDSNHGSQFPT